MPGVVSSQCRVPQVVGGVLTTGDGYSRRTFTASGDLSFVKGTTPGSNYLVVDILLVAGGGGGGPPGDRTGGGGGAGGVFVDTLSILPSENRYADVSIGAGGRGYPVPVTNGGYSALWIGHRDENGLEACNEFVGGGGHGGGKLELPTSGGSGGGGYHTPEDSGRAPSGDGIGPYGGNGYDSGVGGSTYRGGGGGGAGGAGVTGQTSTRGTGGAGYSSSITGTASFYAACGGGGAQITSGDTTYASGGSSGVGGDGAVSSAAAQITAATSPDAYTGSGGGGGSKSSSGTNEATNGASGVLIVRYSTSP